MHDTILKLSDISHLFITRLVDYWAQMVGKL